MNAVNLIPSGGRKRRTRVSASPATLGLLAGLVAVLVGAVLYVASVNDVKSRQSELTRVSASVTSWQAAASRFSPVVQTSQERAQQLGAVRQLADSRFPWSTLLSQIAGVMPAKAALSSLQATSASAAPTPGTTTTAATQPAVQLSGCASSQSMVAQTMEQLHRVNGVSDVTLASAGDGSSGSTPSGSSTSGGSSNDGGCPFPVQFQVSLTLASAPAPTSAGTSTTTAATTPTSSSGSSSTGASQ